MTRLSEEEFEDALSDVVWQGRTHHSADRLRAHNAAILESERELLAALERMVEAFTAVPEVEGVDDQMLVDQWGRDALDTARAAIARARGEAVGA